MDRETIEAKTRQIIIETLNLSETDYAPEANLQLDPLGVVQLAMQLEFQFGIEIDENNFAPAKIQDVLNLINLKMGV